MNAWLHVTVPRTYKTTNKHLRYRRIGLLLSFQQNGKGLEVGQTLQSILIDKYAKQGVTLFICQCLSRSFLQQKYKLLAATFLTVKWSVFFRSQTQFRSNSYHAMGGSVHIDIREQSLFQEYCRNNFLNVIRCINIVLESSNVSASARFLLVFLSALNV